MATYDVAALKDILSTNTYPGRGIIVGKTPDEKNAVAAYFIMGRSENSRNRIFVEKDDGEVVIYPFDESKVEDPSLIIYSPIKKIKNKLIVTNGDQTDTIYDFIKSGRGFIRALRTRGFEPDAPNFTPRISAILTFTKHGFNYRMSILKSADEKGSACNRFNFDYSPISGLGHFLHTYAHDGNPIPTFTGEPERIRINNDIDKFTNEIWDNLNEQNKISLYVRYIDLDSGAVQNRMINKNK